MEPNKQSRQRGFSLVELMTVAIVVIILSAIAIPKVVSINRNLRNTGDARGISAALNLARMRAAADFTHARLYMDTAGNSYHVETWNKASSCWQTDGDTANACTAASSPVTPMDQTDSFGFGTISAGPTAATSSIAQAPLCDSGVAGAAVATTSNTVCIEFNSRSFPVNSTNSIVAGDAVYITDNLKFFSAITVPISGQPATYSYNGYSWAQF